MTISPAALANLPVSAGSGLSTTAVLYVGFTSQPERGRFEADGLDYGLLRKNLGRGV